MNPRFGTIHSGQIYRPRPGAYALLVRGPAALMTLQQTPSPDVQLPGGGIEPGESPVAALHREVFEETGWRIRPLRHIGTYRRYAYLPNYGYWAEKICHVWLAQPVRRLGPPTEPEHVPVWLPLRLVPERLSDPGAGQIVARFLRAQAHRR